MGSLRCRGGPVASDVMAEPDRLAVDCAALRIRPVASIEPVFAVEGDGKYRADWAWLGGMGSVINPKLNAPDGPICSELRASGATGLEMP